MTLSDHFDNLSFSMLKEVRQTLISRKGKVTEEFSSPLRWVDDPCPGYLSKLGVGVSLLGESEVHRLGVIILFDEKEIPNQSKKIRSIFKNKLNKIKKMLLKQYKELERSYGLLERPRREDRMGEEIQARIQQYLQEV